MDRFDEAGIRALNEHLTGGPAEEWATDLLNNVSECLDEITRLRSIVEDRDRRRDDEIRSALFAIGRAKAQHDDAMLQRYLVQAESHLQAALSPAPASPESDGKEGE